MAETETVSLNLDGNFAEKAKTATEALEGLQGGAGSASEALAKVSAGASGSGAASVTASSGITALGGDMQSLLGHATNAGGAVGELQKMIGALGPEGQVAAAALGVLTMAIEATVGALLKMEDAAISIVQQRAALLATFSALAGGAPAGKASLEMVERLGKSLPFATEQIGVWAKSLMSAGIKGKDLEESIKAVAAATALMGEAGGEAAQTMIKRLAEGGAGATKAMKDIQQGGTKANKILADMGLVTADVAAAAGMTEEAFKKAHLSAAQMQKAIEDALKKKGAGPLDELGSTFPVMIQKVKEGLASLFEDLGPAVKPFMASIKALFAEFSKGGGVIEYLKPIVTEVFSTLFAWGTRAVGVVHAVIDAFMASTKSGGILSGAISALKSTWEVLVGIWHATVAAAQPLIAKLKEIFSNAETMNGIKLIFKGIAIAIGVVIVVVVAVVAVFVLLVAAAATLAAKVAGGFAQMVSGVVGLGSRMIAAVKGYAAGFAGAGRDMISGLVGALTGGIGAAVAAAVNLVKSALAAARAAVGAHSPATAFVDLGKDMGAGQVVGVKASNDNARAAGVGLAKSTAAGAKSVGVGDAAKGAGGSSGAPSGAKGGGDTYNVTIMQPPGATKKEGADFAEGFTKRMRDLAAEAA